MVIILVGSETGNSLDYGSRLVDDLERLGVESELFLMDEFPLERLCDEDLSTLLFVCSTTGDGEEPQNMKKFMKFLLRADLPVNIFSEIEFGVFGLGDSSYDKFNFVGKRVYRRMGQLGGGDLVGFRGEGDERGLKGIEGGWIAWWTALERKMMAKSDRKRGYTDSEPLPPRHAPILTKTLRSDNSNTDNSNTDNSNTVNSNIHNSNTINTSKLLNCKLSSCDRLTPIDHFQDTRLIKFKIKDKINFKPGDILNLKPSNDPKESSDLVTLMDWQEESIVYGIEGKNLLLNWEIEFPMNLIDFVTNWIDFTRIPTRNSFKTLASLCSPNHCEYSQLHYEKLLELASDEGEYLDYVWRPKRSFLEILKDFQPSLKIEINRILQVFPLIKPRQFSIANYSEDDSVIEVLIALIKDDLPFGRGKREGLCSNWISSNRIESIQSLSVSHGSINYSILSSPSISKIFLFATGTGIAPIRSIIKHLKPKEIYLYFGFRSKETDFYFQNEWETLSQNVSIRIFSQGSRDNPTKKVYIDDLVKNNSEPLLALKSPENICCVVAGHSRLNKLIQTTLKEIWGERGIEWIDFLKKRNQFQTETWS